MSENKQIVDEKKLKEAFEIKSSSQLGNVDKVSRKKTQAELSDDAYQEITKQVIGITEKNLNKQADAKERLRVPLQQFISGMLFLQFLALLVLLFFNGVCFNLEAEIIKTYIVSVFAETLVGLIVMVKFAFSNDQEVQLMQILNAVVSNFQVFGNNNNRENNDNNQ